MKPRQLDHDGVVLDSQIVAVEICGIAPSPIEEPLEVGLQGVGLISNSKVIPQGFHRATRMLEF